jgi:very-short-patch-repair endonuclease
VGLAEALVRVTLDHDLEVSAPCIDWALASGRLDRFAFEQFVVALPASARCIRDWVDPRCQSILESVARVRLLRRGWSLRSQVGVGDFESIDLVVEGVVALELDGRKHHESTFDADRRKDLSIIIEGRHPIRVSYDMVMSDWERVEFAIIAAAAARGCHLAHRSGIALREPRGARYATGAGRVID